MNKYDGIVKFNVTGSTEPDVSVSMYDRVCLSSVLDKMSESQEALHDTGSNYLIVTDYGKHLKIFVCDNCSFDFDKYRAAYEKESEQAIRSLADHDVDPDMPNMLKKELVGEIRVIDKNPRYDPKAQYSKRYIKVVRVEFYMSRSGDGASPVHCLVWFQSKQKPGQEELSYRGSGTAGGYGYDKMSAALEIALAKAGVTFKHQFGGCGEQSSKTALMVLAKRLGWSTADTI